MDLDRLEAPKMTYYVRIISNITGKILTDWAMYDSSLWYYGKCNNQGGESEYIVELDIWNNEPSFNAGLYNYINLDAYNCSLTVDTYDSKNVDLFKLSEPFLYARCSTTNKREEWSPITKSIALTNIYGNMSQEVGILKGNADHALIQTKIIMPKNDILSNSMRYAFNLVFNYDYE